jgi:hypothetical protein
LRDYAVGGSTPTQDYRIDGEKIPGNTTVIGQNLGWKTPGLMGWQKKIIKAQMCPTCLSNFKDPNKIKDDAADAGTLAHLLIEHDIKNLAAPDISKYPKDIIDKAETGFLNYLAWKEGIRFILKNMEVPLISHKYRYGTTVDVVALANGKTCLVECKTSNDIYTDFLIQLAAQKAAWDENYPDDPICGVHILKVHKEHASFSHHYFGELPGCFEAFLDLRDLHDRKKQLEKLL